MVRYHKFKIIIALLLACFSTKGQDTVNRTILWKANEDGVFAHFVYGLTVTQRGTILAFAEARINDGTDEGAHHIVLKRSVDKGDSFSASTIIVKSENGQCWANPTAVQDRKTGRLFLFYALNQRNAGTAVFYKCSNDDGVSWSEATAVTFLFDNNPYNWTFHLPGPGHGIQLKNKRLMVSIWHRRSISFSVAERQYGVNCIYSDDQGKTWKSGGYTPVGELNESQIVEQANGNIFLIGRTVTGVSGSRQAKVWSKDKGESWTQELDYDSALKGSACDIGLVRYSSKPNVILLSQPAGLKKRNDLTIRMSKDEGRTWPISKLLQEGGATYSDLAVLPDKSIICLYGHGGSKHMPEAVSLARFRLKWLLER